MLNTVNNYIKTTILGTALTVGGVGIYDEMTPPAATYLQQVNNANLVESVEPQEEGFVHSEIKHDQQIVSSKESVVVDLVAKGPPQQDNYPRGLPKEGDGASVKNENNFGVAKINQ